MLPAVMPTAMPAGYSVPVSAKSAISSTGHQRTPMQYSAAAPTPAGSQIAATCPVNCSARLACAAA